MKYILRVAASLAAGCALAVAALALRIAPGRVVKWAATRGDAGERASVPAPVSSKAVPALAHAVALVGTRVHATCLQQGVALLMLFTVARLPGRLVIGVAPGDSVLRAHAWVESAGRAILGAREAAGYHRFPVAASACRP
jgi:hypothetical protein